MDGNTIIKRIEDIEKNDIKINTIYNCNCLELMTRMSDDFIDLTVTSPPYDNLRDYQRYSFPFENIAKELYRVTKEGGIVVWIVGDSTIDGSESGTSFKQALYFKEIGFKLHDTMIYEKNGSSYPSSDKSTRYSNIFEYMFILSKGQPKTHNLIKDKPNRWRGNKPFGSHTKRQKDGTLKRNKSFIVSEFGYRNNIWRINTGYGYSAKDEIAYKHPAIFPESLVRDHIITWSNERDIVYDPFMGSGTTAKLCILLNRKYIGSEISPEYCKIAEKRLEPYLTQLTIW